MYYISCYLSKQKCPISEAQEIIVWHVCTTGFRGRLDLFVTPTEAGVLSTRLPLLFHSHYSGLGLNTIVCLGLGSTEEGLLFCLQPLNALVFWS